MDIVITLLAIMGVLLVAVLASAGIRTAAKWLSTPAHPALPDGVERVNVKKKTFYNGLILVRYAWYLPEFGKYVAYIQCPYLDEYKRIEASSIEKLEEAIEDKVEKFMQKARKKDMER